MLEPHRKNYVGAAQRQSILIPQVMGWVYDDGSPCVKVPKAVRDSTADRQVEAFDEGGVECGRVFRFDERFAESPVSTDDVSPLDANHTVVSSGLSSWP